MVDVPDDYIGQCEAKSAIRDTRRGILWRLAAGHSWCRLLPGMLVYLRWPFLDEGLTTWLLIGIWQGRKLMILIFQITRVERKAAVEVDVIWISKTRMEKMRQKSMC